MAPVTLSLHKQWKKERKMLARRRQCSKVMELLQKLRLEDEEGYREWIRVVKDNFYGILACSLFLGSPQSAMSFSFSIKVASDALIQATTHITV